MKAKEGEARSCLNGCSSLALLYISPAQEHGQELAGKIWGSL